MLKKTVSLEPDVKGVVGKVALGQADAGFVYLTDIAPVATRVRAIAIPARAQPTVVYELAIAAKPNDLEAAQDVVIAVLGPMGGGSCARLASGSRETDGLRCGARRGDDGGALVPADSDRRHLRRALAR